MRAALGLADEEGLAAVSMRRLGAELGVEAMSLYNHIPNKAAVLDGIAAAVWAEISLPEGEGAWTERIREMARAFRRLAHAHPNVFPLVATRPVEDRPAMRPIEAALATLRSAGFGDEMVVHALNTLVGFVYGYAMREITALTVSGGPEPRGWLDAGRIPHEQFPNLVGLAPRLAAYDYDAGFEVGLDAILTGLESGPERGGHRGPASPSGPRSRPRRPNLDNRRGRL